MEFTRVGPPLSEADIASFEQQIGGTLPDDYRDFLVTTNGGVPEVRFVNDPVRELVGVEGFFSVGEVQGELSMSDALATWGGRYPNDMLPLALCGGSNLLLLTLGGQSTNPVYYWEHDGEANEGEPARTDNLTQLATSFSGLLESLHDEDLINHPEVQRMMGGDVWVAPDFNPGPRKH